MGSSIKITFAGAPQINDVISFAYKDLSSHDPLEENILTSVWKKPRTQKGEVNMSSILPYTAALGVIDYWAQFTADYNFPAIFIVKSALGQQITIEAINGGIEFLNFASTNANITAVIVNEPYIPDLETDKIEYLEAEINPTCTHSKVKVTSTKVVTSVTSPVVLSPNSNIFEFEVLRETSGILSYTDGVTDVSHIFSTPKILENPTVNVTNTPTGANAILSVGGDGIQNLQWSLNGVDYQISSIFQNLLSGNYVAYVKDSFNCVKQTAFTIDNFSLGEKINTPIFYVSNANSIRFKDYEVWDNKDIYKTDANTLSIEESKDSNRLIYPYIQKWQKNDSEYIEVLSSYKSIIARTYQNGVVKDLIVNKETDNIGRKDKRDCRIFETDDAKIGIYFLTGNIYDYDTGLVTGGYGDDEDLPEWAVINNNVWIEEMNNFLTIEDILFDPEKGKQVLIFTGFYDGDEKDTKISSVYNIKPFEVYRIPVDFSQYDCFQVLIEATDDVFKTKTKLSEVQKVLEYQKGTIELKYRSDENNDVYYAIKNLGFTLRLDYNSFDSVSDDEKEVHKSDTKVIPLNSSLYPKKQIIFPRLTTVMAEKVEQALGQKVIALNRELFTVDNNVEKTKTGNTNLYDIKAVLYRTQEDVDGSADIDLVFPKNIASPKLLDTGTGGFLIVDSSNPVGYLAIN